MTSLRSTAVALSTLVLLLAAPHPRAALAVLRSSGATGDPTAALVAAVALIAWLGVAWLLLTLALTAGSRRRGWPGRWCAVALRRTAPALLRRAAALTLGVGLGLGSAGAAVAAGPAPGASTSYDWPGTSPTAASTAAPTALPSTGPQATGGRSVGGPPVTPAPGTAAPATPAPAGPAPRSLDAGPGSSAVIVRPGDTLWSIAAAHLPGPAPVTAARTATAWPAWWAANRDVVGDDPDLLHPGQLLLPPPPG